MRTAFAQELAALAKTNDKIVLLVGDIGNTLFDEFKAVAPDRFFNCGIAEQNMVSMAAGLAKSGFRPVCFTIAPFLTARCFEQIKIDCGYHNVPVVLAAVGAGLCYANLGPTHQALDDIAILRTVPNLKIAVPSDKTETRLCLRACLAEAGPTYLRIGRDSEPDLLPTITGFNFGSWWHAGYSRADNPQYTDVRIFCCGATAASMVPSFKTLLGPEVRWEAAYCASVKPMPYLKWWATSKLTVVIEEHGVGGLGSMLAETFAADGWTANHKLIRIGTPDEFLHSPMTPAEARDYCGLTPEKIAQRIRDELARLR